MFDTAVSVLVVVAFVLPGFVIARLAQVGRARDAAESDWALILRALGYAVLLHGVALFWTAHLYNKIHGSSEAWTHHVWAVTAYAGVLLVALPAGIGLTLGTILNRAEQRGRLAWWHHLLGATDVRDAWDYAFQLMERETFLIVRTDKELVAGRYTTRSWAGRTPSPHDLFLEEVWLLVDDVIVEPMEPPYGVWIPASSIRDVYISRPRDDGDSPSDDGAYTG
jgi:hypothetical protein